MCKNMCTWLHVYTSKNNSQHRSIKRHAWNWIKESCTTDRFLGQGLQGNHKDRIQWERLAHCTIVGAVKEKNILLLCYYIKNVPANPNDDSCRISRRKLTSLPYKYECKYSNCIWDYIGVSENGVYLKKNSNLISFIWQRTLRLIIKILGTSDKPINIYIYIIMCIYIYVYIYICMVHVCLWET